MRYLLLIILGLTSLTVYADPPDWQAPEPGGYNYSASINAALIINESLTASANDRIAFFIGDELRGVSTPVAIGTQVFHLATVFSNTAIGEEMEVRVYHAATDGVYTAQLAYPFVHQGVSGSFDEPFIVEVFSDGDSPIALQEMPALQTLQGVPFAPLSLLPFLERQDDDGIAWSADFNPHFSTLFDGDELSLIPTDINWFGTTTLIIRATEQTSNAYFATAELTVTVEEAYAGPQWEDVPVQSAAPQDGFDLLSLPEFETSYGGLCLDYSLTPLLEESGGEPFPTGWTAPILAQPYSTNISALVQYTHWLPLGHEGDLLAFFIDGQLSGSAAPDLINGRAYYFATIHHAAPTGEADVYYYSALHEAVFTLPVQLPFGGTGQLGSPDEPLVLDFSPFFFELDEAGQLSITPQDTAFRGAHPYTFLAADCDYPEALQDTVSTQLCYDIDSDQDGLCNTLDPAPFDPCFPDYEAPPLDILDGDGDTLVHKGTLEVSTNAGSCSYTAIWRAFSVEECSGVTVTATLEDLSGQEAGNLEMVLLDAETGQYALYLTVPQGTYELEVVATDDYDNRVDFLYTFIVEDNEAPELNCLGIPLPLSFDGTAALTADEVFDFETSGDNCELDYSSLVIDQTDFSCADLGLASVTLTASDIHGNSNSCTAQVEVFIDESIPPPWGIVDIGAVPGASTFSYDPCATGNPDKGHYTIETTTYNSPGGNTDGLASLTQELCNDSGIRIEVLDVGPSTQAGVFMRNSPVEESPMVGYFTNLNPLLFWEQRDQLGADKSTTLFSAVGIPKSLGLRRKNGLIQAFYRLPGGGGWQLTTQVADNLDECVEVGFGAFTNDPGGAAYALIGNVSVINTSNAGFNPVHEFSEVPESARIWPNPAVKSATLALPQPLAQASIIRLKDGLGRSVRSWSLAAGEMQYRLNLQGLAPGLYLLQMEHPHAVQRLVISR